MKLSIKNDKNMMRNQSKQKKIVRINGDKL